MPSTPEWFVAVHGQPQGPLPIEDVAERIRSGEVDGTTLAYGPGMANWAPLASVPALAAQLADGPASRAEDPSHGLEQFLRESGERDRPGDVFELESKKMLEAHVDGRTWAKLGSMIAYRGDLRFVREGALEGGLGKLVTRMVSGELAPLVKIEGRGVVYLADQKKNVSLLRLRAQDAISVNGNDLLAFEQTVRHEITMHRRVAGMLAGGLFSVRLDGPGMIAITTHGEPLTLRATAQDPVTTDPHATVAWSANLAPEIRTDVSFRSFIGRGGGETFQLRFAGEGFVVVQPYEEVPTAPRQGRR